MVVLIKGSTSTIAIPQLFKAMLLRNRTSAIPQSQFFLCPQLQVRNLRASFPQFLAYFWPWNLVGVHENKSEVKKSRATVPLRQVFVFRETEKYFWLIFKTIPGLRKGTRK
jgi:hypothetical protein